MKKLSFKFISNNDELINDEFNYINRNNSIVFKVNDETYEYNTVDHLIIKKDKEKELIIELKNNNIIINLLDNNYSFDLPIIVNKYTYNDNVIEIEYKSEDIINNIFIIL